MRICLALLLATSLLACSPKPTEPVSDADAEIVPSNPYFGKWQLVRAQVAPWWDGKGEEPVADTALTMLEFTPTKSSGAPIVDCAKPQYSVSLISPAGLFQGTLKEPFVQARAMGFPINGSDITSMNLTCSENQKDVSLDFPMLANDTIMLGLDNVIYTLQRSSH